MAISQILRHSAKLGAMVVAVSTLGSGCVAFNVGKPAVIEHRKTVETTSWTPSRTEMLSVEGNARVEGDRVSAWLDADVREEYQKWQYEEVTRETRQKRLALGLFPGAGETVYRPRGTPLALGKYAKSQVFCTLFLVVPVLSTFESLLLEPFGSWHDDGAFWRGRLESWSGEDIYSHFGWVGIHKTLRIAKTGPIRDGPDRSAGTEARRRRERLAGPYEVELRIPGAGIADKATVGAGSSNAAFVLPQVEHGGTYEATLEFRSLYAGTEDVVRKAWQTRTLKMTVWLAEKPKPAPVAVHAPQTQPVREVVREVVREIQYVERKPEGPPYAVEKTVDRTGRTVWRVKILAGNLNAFAVDAQVKPQILRELQDDFAGRNPEVPRGEIKAFASYTTEDGGRTLVYVGVAESLIPKLESLTYSAETHRGTVTMRLAGGADLRHAKEFVRANISAIVCDKNVVLTAGERPPDGATYRSLDENFADGVLTVEFEGGGVGGRLDCEGMKHETVLM